MSDGKWSRVKSLKMLQGGYYWSVFYVGIYNVYISYVHLRLCDSFVYNLSISDVWWKIKQSQVSEDTPRGILLKCFLRRYIITYIYIYIYIYISYVHLRLCDSFVYNLSISDVWWKIKQSQVSEDAPRGILLKCFLRRYI
jgi:hypothetical protein